MERINQVFNAGKVFAAYITAGDGTLDYQLSMVRALLAGGVNLLEIGVPFSDPMADGVVIQRAMDRALKAGTTMEDVLRLVTRIREESDVPMVLFTYYNPIYVQQSNLLARAKKAGIDGILVVDLPFFEGQSHLEQCEQLHLAPIAIVSPSTSPERLTTIARQGKGFLYYACQKGTTGVRSGLPDDLTENIHMIRNHSTLPILIGFGIADRIASQAALAMADGFVVGSYFISAMEAGKTPDEITALTRNFL